MRRGQARPFAMTFGPRLSNAMIFALLAQRRSRAGLDYLGNLLIHFVVLFFAFSGSNLFAADYDEARSLFRSGKYDEAMAMAQGRSGPRSLE